MKARLAARATVWFPLLLLAALTGLSFWLEYLVTSNEPVRDARARHAPDLILQSFNAESLGPAGVPVYTLAAATLQRFPDDQTVRLDDPRFVQISDTGITTSITSKYGTVSGPGDNVYFMDDVKVVRSPYKDRSQLSLDTSYLQVTPELGLARTDRPVLIRDASTTATAVGLELRDEDRIVTLLSRVKGQYVPPKRTGPSARSPSDKK
ncbi:MAG: LPS export ABC transporter periplasmic protein LptC [Betaproteobacteria bacterium]|nr:LPS export ABC transporter periplasmic protein LptC [Betaproteobacteria bacterium]